MAFTLRERQNHATGGYHQDDRQLWIGYQLTQSSTSTITKATLYEGVLRVLMIFKAYATPTSVATFTRLEQHYHALANQESL